MLEEFDPVTFEFAVGAGKPHFQGRGKAHEMIDVPVRGGRSLEVMCQTPAEATGPERAADVGVKSGEEIESAEAAHRDSFEFVDLDEEDVGPFLGWQVGSRIHWSMGCRCAPPVNHSIR